MVVASLTAEQLSAIKEDSDPVHWLHLQILSQPIKTLLNIYKFNSYPRGGTTDAVIKTNRVMLFKAIIDTAMR
jgi:hypothetical protein